MPKGFYPRKSIEVRFWRGVNKNGPIHPVLKTRCWIWTASTDKCGYGQISMLKKNCKSHRVSWRLHFGEIPGELLVLHACDNPKCVNPNHLFLGTSRDNSEDMKQKGRQAKGDKHYSKTHPEKVLRGDRSGPRKHPERMARGEAHGMVKLTEIEVIEIRKRLTEREAQQSIANFYGVHQTMVSRIKLLKAWKTVDIESKSKSDFKGN